MALAVAVVILLDGYKTPALLSETVINGNSVRASSTTGSVGIFGAGLANNRPAVLTNVQIMRNVARATAPTGWVRGGGIFNGLVFPRPKPDLTLKNSSVTSNSIDASSGVTSQGGGLFTRGFHVTMERSVIAHEQTRAVLRLLRTRGRAISRPCRRLLHKERPRFRGLRSSGGRI